MRILVVEDESSMAALLRQSLAEAGHAVDVAETGEAALEWVDLAHYDAIVLDVMLPDIDGLEVCRRLRHWQMPTPILLLTAKDTVEDRVAGLDAGADDYLVKPFSFAELTARLRALARRPAVLLAAVLVLFGAALLIGLRIRLASAFDDQLREQVALTLPHVKLEGSDVTLDPAQAAPLQRSGTFVRLLDRDGAVVTDTSTSLGDVPLDAHAIAAARRGETQVSTVHVRDRSIRIVTAPVPASGAVAGVLQVGLPLSEIDEVMRELLGAILLATPAAAATSLAGGYLMARRALEPVVAISRMAEGIGGGTDLQARLGLELPDDELGQLVKTFDAMLERISGAFDRQRRFTGDAAHELRTPLALMRGRIDLARSQPRTDEEHLATLDGLDADLARLSGVVGALLVLARSDAGRLVVAREPFDLAVTMARVAGQYAETGAMEGVALRVEAPPTPFDGDEDLLVQVLVNLVDNALAHTPPGGTVTMGCLPDGAAVRLWVADTGSGIAPHHQARIFDRFYRVDAGRARSTGGAGLGLSMCREIVEAHGGTIALASEVGRGTRVEVILPIPPTT